MQVFTTVARAPNSLCRSTPVLNRRFTFCRNSLRQLPQRFSLNPRGLCIWRISCSFICRGRRDTPPVPPAPGVSPAPFRTPATAGCNPLPDGTLCGCGCGRSIVVSVEPCTIPSQGRGRIPQPTLPRQWVRALQRLYGQNAKHPRVQRTRGCFSGSSRQLDLLLQIVRPKEQQLIKGRLSSGEARLRPRNPFTRHRLVLRWVAPQRKVASVPRSVGEHLPP